MPPRVGGREDATAERHAGTSSGGLGTRTLRTVAYSAVHLPAPRADGCCPPCGAGVPGALPAPTTSADGIRARLGPLRQFATQAAGALDAPKKRQPTTYRTPEPSESGKKESNCDSVAILCNEGGGGNRGCVLRLRTWVMDAGASGEHWGCRAGQRAPAGMDGLWPAYTIAARRLLW